MGSEIYIREKLEKKRVSIEEIKRIAMNNEELFEAAEKCTRSKACCWG
jgi:hypothetical protein